MKHFKNNRIVIALGFLLVLMTLTACSLLKTKLTKENIDDYLTITIKEKTYNATSVHWSEEINGKRQLVYQYLQLTGNVKGASTNFNYNDVSVKLKVTMTCTGFDIDTHEREERVIEEIIDFDTDIAGNAKQAYSKTYNIDGYGVNQNTITTNVEILEVNGSVSKAK